MNNYKNYDERLHEMIELAYNFFCHQVGNGIIRIGNEASMQLQLSNILLQLSHLYVFSASEHFNVSLEEKITLNEGTPKTPNKKARADIWIELTENSEVLSQAAIELKYFKKPDGHAAAVTDNRYSIWKDLQNLEQYEKKEDGLLIVEIVCSDDPIYSQKAYDKLTIKDGTIISSFEGDSTYNDIKLDYKYKADWNILGDFHFLMLTPQ
jgi:hypothetical protein